jgi:hypothetical protein
MNQRLEKFFSTRWSLLALYALFLGAYMFAAGARLRTHSPYNHFVYLADGWLEGRLALKGEPPNENDWAKVEVLTLADGRVVRGKFGSNGPEDRFYFTKGGSETITADEIRSRAHVRYVSFPPFPAVAMLPFVAVAKWIFHNGLGFNDVIFTVLWAAANPVLLFLLLRDLVRRGHSKRTVGDNLLLTLMLGLGSVYYVSSVLGQVWFTALVVGVTMTIGYAWAAIDASRPWLAGVFLGLGFASRAPLGYTVVLFVWEAVRVSGGWRHLRDTLAGEKRLPAGLFPRLWKCALPAAGILAALFAFNYARFDRFTVFGHEYLNITWKERAEHWGLFNYHFLSRNLTCALVLLPKILATYPYVKYSQHGMSLFVTSPNLAWLFGRREKSPLEPGLWLAVVAAAVPTLLYYLSGYQQFGYRFSNDYFVYLVLLLALGGQRFGFLFKAALVVAIAVNIFGAVTFGRYPEFAYEDACIFPHGCN